MKNKLLYGLLLAGAMGISLDGYSQIYASEIKVQQTGAKVGIGTDIPDHMLSVFGTTRIASEGYGGGVARNGILAETNGTRTQLRWQHFGQSINPYIAVDPSADAAKMIFGTNGADRLVIAANGNIGIGNPTPDYQLDVVGVGRFTSSLYLGSSLTVGGADIVLGTNDGRNQGAIKTNRAFVHTDWGIGTDNLVMNFDGDYEGGVEVQGPKLVVSGGNIGIGANYPTNALEITRVPHAERAHVFFGHPTATSGQASSMLTFAGSGIQHAGFSWKPNSNLALGQLNLTFGGYSNPNLNNIGVTFQSNGFVGIGTTTPHAKLHIHGNTPTTTNLVLSANYANIFRWRMKTVDRGYSVDMDFTASDGSDIEEVVMQLTRSNSTRPEFRLVHNAIVANNGLVGIGMDAPTERLHVNGNIKGNIIYGTSFKTWPDYVFTPTYALPNLSELKAFIDKNKHLPNIPSAAQMEAAGVVDVVDMEIRLLEKVEELTLYAIEQEEKLASQGKTLTALQQENQQLQAYLKMMEARLQAIERAAEKE